MIEIWAREEKEPSLNGEVDGSNPEVKDIAIKEIEGGKQKKYELSGKVNGCEIVATTSYSYLYERLKIGEVKSVIPSDFITEIEHTCDMKVVERWIEMIRNIKEWHIAYLSARKKAERILINEYLKWESQQQRKKLYTIPTNIGNAVVGFSSFGEAERFAQSNDMEIFHFQREGNQKVWEYVGSACCALDACLLILYYIGTDDDDVRFYTSEDFQRRLSSERQVIEEEFYDGYMSTQERFEYLIEIEKRISSLENLREGRMLRWENGCFEKEYPIRTMEWSEYVSRRGSTLHRIIGCAKTSEIIRCRKAITDIYDDIKRSTWRITDFSDLRRHIENSIRGKSNAIEAIYFEGSSSFADKTCKNTFGKDYKQYFSECETITLEDAYSSQVDISLYLYSNDKDVVVFFTCKANPYYTPSNRPKRWNLKTAYLGNPDEEE